MEIDTSEETVLLAGDQERAPALEFLVDFDRGQLTLDWSLAAVETDNGISSRHLLLVDRKGLG